jgi:lipopolysaccharide transport system permease protein
MLSCMRPLPTQPAQICTSLFHHRSLILTLVKRDVLGRYRGSILGLLWSLLHPLVMLGLYWFVFGVVFKSRWSSDGASQEPHFALALFAGLLIFNIFAECVNRAPSLITSNVNYVKKVIFPLEILPCVALLSALFHAAVSLVILCFAHLVINQAIPWTVLLAPILIVPLCLFSLGLGWLLSSLGVYLRDIGQLTGVFTTILLFLSAIFFPLSSLPPSYASILSLNPLVYIIEASRSLLVTGVIPSLGSWVVVTVCGFIVAQIGFVWFQKSRKGFADVL